jgi:OOP family OmpA-OmpF porin
MNLPRCKPLVLAAATFAGALHVSAQAEGLYVGGSIGKPSYGDAINGIGTSNSGVSGKLFGGYQIAPGLAVEAGVADLGHSSNASGSIRSHGEYLDAVGSLPLAQGFSLLGSAGIDHLNLNTSNGDDSGFGLKLGVGGEYSLTPTTSIRAEYERYQASSFGGHPSVGQYTIGVRVGF